MRARLPPAFWYAARAARRRGLDVDRLVGQHDDDPLDARAVSSRLSGR